MPRWQRDTINLNSVTPVWQRIVVNSAVAATRAIDCRRHRRETFDATEPMATVPVGAVDLEQLAKASPSQQQAMADAVAATLPKNVVAHRLGDFVFPYHGMNLNHADPTLWTVMMDPIDPDLLATTQAIEVGFADGTTRSIPQASFRQALANQNTLRAKYGLAPLPDPSQVTATQPAGGP